MNEVLVSHPERLLLARASSGELAETTLVVPDLLADFVEYFRCLVMNDGTVHEHAVVLVAPEPSRALLAQVVDILGRRKKTRVVIASARAAAPNRLEGESSGYGDASALAAVLRGVAGHAEPLVAVAEGDLEHRIAVTFEARLWRCRSTS